MSAYIVSNKHINVIVTAYAALAEIRDPAELQRIAELLINENHRSVNCRYGSNDVAGPIVYRDEPRSQARVHWAARCLRYQSCEHQAWDESEACKIVEQLIAATREVDMEARWDEPEYDNEATCTDNLKVVESEPEPAPPAPMPKIKFRKFFCERDGIKCKVYYWATARSDGSVTVKAKQYGHDLADIFDGVEGIKYRNDTDSQIDYFEKSSVTIPVGHPLYAEVRALCKD